MIKYNNKQTTALGSQWASMLATYLIAVGTLTSVQAQTTLNVTDFGAQGDAVQFWVNTTSNSVVLTTTNQLPSAAIGDAIEIFQAGTQTYGVNSYGTNAFGNQDLVATITNVVDGTNIYISQPAQATLTNTFATYGHNNQTNFQTAIAAATATTNAIINIPAGTYLFLATPNIAYGYAGIILSAGGITFNGAGTNLTTLLSQGAWNLQSYAGHINFPTRGFLIEEHAPIKNNYTVVFENMTLDGGVPQGNTSIHGITANPVDGLGWDQTHDAFLVWGPGHNSINNMTWTNLVFQHWRGEMVKSIDGSTNGNLNIFNCVFNDGNATAINIYPALNISNCVFDNLFQVAEYYQAYSTNTSYFQNNLVTNITANGFAINGGKGNNPSFIIQNNMFYFPGNGYNGIMTTPGDNVFIISNQFIYPYSSYGIAIDLGAPGYQGTYDNSNIVVVGNNFIEPGSVVEIAGGTSSTDPTRVESVQVYSNTLTHTSGGGCMVLQGYNWSTNVHFFSNDFFSHVSLGPIGFSSGAFGSPYALVDVNNLYYGIIYDFQGKTNSISYGGGSRFEVVYTFTPGTVYVLCDSNSNQIPVGAEMMIKNALTPNNNSPISSFPLYLNSAMTRGPLTVTNGQSATFQWTNGTWQLLSQIAPPTSLQIISP